MSERPIIQDDIAQMFANPFYCVNIHPIMCMDHEPTVSEEQWIQAALVSIKEDPEEFLKNLLLCLKWESHFLWYTIDEQ